MYFTSNFLIFLLFSSHFRSHFPCIICRFSYSPLFRTKQCPVKTVIRESGGILAEVECAHLLSVNNHVEKLAAGRRVEGLAEHPVSHCEKLGGHAPHLIIGRQDVLI
jgi:Zn-finger protein